MTRRLLAAAFALFAVPALAADAPEPVLRATLSNGLQVVIVPDRLAPVATMDLNYLAGSNDAPPGFPGTAHALEHMMFRGSAGLDRDQLAELGALLGGNNNANTTETVTQYTATVPSADLPLVLQAEALRMRGLTLAQADWEQERGAIEQEVSRDFSSPFYTFASQAQAILFAGTPYEHDALGTRESFDKTDAALLRRFYEQWYAPNNAILVIAGDVKPEQTLAQVRAAFGDIPPRDLPPHPAIAPQPVEPKTLELRTDFSVGLVTLAYRMPGLKSQDFAAADILGDVLASQRGAIYGLVPAGRALMAQFDYQAKPDVGFGLALAAFPAGGDPAPVLADLRQVIAQTVQTGVPPELVESAKRQEQAQLAFAGDSIAGLAGNWSRALARQGMNAPDELARAYGAVTVDDVNRLARALLDPAHVVTAILTPQNDGAPGGGKGYGGSESLTSAPDHPVTLPDWAAAAIARPPLPEPVAPPDISVLPNGLRLIVQPEHVSHAVSVYGRVREEADMQVPPGKEGLSTLTAELFSYGTESHDRLAFRKEVDNLAAVLHAGPGFRLKVLADDFEAGMKLLAENELHPAFPPKAFEVARARMAQSVAGERKTPDYQLEIAAARATVPPGDPSLRESTPETVAALQPADVRAYFQANYRPDLTTIVVLGDVTAEQARRVVAETFGGWQANGPTPAIDLPPVPASKASDIRVADATSLQDSVTLIESLPLPVTHPDRYKLLLGNVVLGDGFASRLYQDLRVKTGYVYSVSSSFDWTRTRADYSVSFGADAANVAKARQLVLRDLQDMQTAPVSETELARAKTELLRWLPMQRDSMESIAAGLLHRAGLGLPYEPPQVIGQRFLDIDAEQIRQAFAAWVRPADLAQVVKGPPLE